MFSTVLPIKMFVMISFQMALILSATFPFSMCVCVLNSVHDGPTVVFCGPSIVFYGYLSLQNNKYTMNFLFFNTIVLNAPRFFQNVGYALYVCLMRFHPIFNHWIRRFVRINAYSMHIRPQKKIEIIHNMTFAFLLQ